MADTQLNSIQNIMQYLGVNTSERMQAWYNTALVGKETTALNLNDFVWGQKMLECTYEFLELEDQITPMASVVGYESEPAPVGNDISARKLSGSIPMQSWKIVQGINDYRGMMKALAEADKVAQFEDNSPARSMRQYLLKYFFNNMASFTESHAALLNYQIGQMLSKGQYTVTAANNPQGGIRDVTFKAHVLDKNIDNTEFWTEDASGKATYIEAVDPVVKIASDMNDIRNNEDGNGFSSIKGRMTRKTFQKFINHPAVEKHLGYALSGLTLRQSPNNDKNAVSVAQNFKLYNGSNESVIVEEIRKLLNLDVLQIENNVCETKTWDATSKKFVRNRLKPFEDGVLLISPTGVIGELKNAVPLRADGQAIVASIFGGHGIIEYRYNRETKQQVWVSEMTVLPVPTNPSRLHYYNMVGVTSTDTYTEVTNPTGNPKTQGYYEKNSSGEYVLTEDTTVQSGKTYYTKS